MKTTQSSGTRPVHQTVAEALEFKSNGQAIAIGFTRQQLKRFDEINAQVEKNVKALNQHLVQLEAITEPRLRSDQKRVYYNGNLLFVDFKKLGVPRVPDISRDQ